MTAEKEIHACREEIYDIAQFVDLPSGSRAAFIVVSTWMWKCLFHCRDISITISIFQDLRKILLSTRLVRREIHRGTYEIIAKEGRIRSWKSLRLSRNNKYTSNGTRYTRRKNFSRNLLRIFPLHSTSPRNVLRTFFPGTGAACSSTVSWLSRVSWRSRVGKEAVISLTVTRLREESGNARARRRRERCRTRRSGVAKAFNFPLLADGGRHTPFRSELSLPESYGRRMSGWGGPNVA